MLPVLDCLECRERKKLIAYSLQKFSQNIYFNFAERLCKDSGRRGYEGDIFGSAQAVRAMHGKSPFGRLWDALLSKPGVPIGTECDSIYIWRPEFL